MMTLQHEMRLMDQFGMCGGQAARRLWGEDDLQSLLGEVGRRILGWPVAARGRGATQLRSRSVMSGTC